MATAVAVQKSRVTFTDWRGSLLVYASIWLTPVYLAYAYTRSIYVWLLAPFIYLVMMAQHKLHRAMKKTTAARYEQIHTSTELLWFYRFYTMAAVYWILVAMASLAGMLPLRLPGLELAMVTAALIMFYSGPLHREWWIGVTHWLGTISATAAVASTVSLGYLLLTGGFSSLVWMLHKGLRIVTGDYGQVPVEFRHVAEVFAAWMLAVLLIAAAVATGV